MRTLGTYLRVMLSSVFNSGRPVIVLHTSWWRHTRRVLECLVMATGKAHARLQKCYVHSRKGGLTWWYCFLVARFF